MKAHSLPWWFWIDEYGDVLRNIWADPARPTICDNGIFKEDPCEWWGWMAEQLWAIREGMA